MTKAAISFFQAERF